MNAATVLSHLAVMEKGNPFERYCQFLESACLTVYKFYPLKIHWTHELNEGDFIRRLEFCENFTDDINDNLLQYLFSNELTSFLNVNINRQSDTRAM